MPKLSATVQKVTTSPIREMFNRAIGMEDVVSFTVGEPDFATPKHIVDAAVDALRRGEHHYTPNAGILPLRQAISRSVQDSHGLYYDPRSQVIVTAGGMEALMLIMLSFLDPGDEVILSDPGWTNYSRQIQIAGGVPKFVSVDAEHGFQYAPEALEAAITPRTKAFIVNSPANPTGGIAEMEQLRAYADIAIRHDLFVISDEVYSRLTYDGELPASIAALAGMEQRAVIVNSFSKTYAMTGWRVGYALGPEEIISSMVRLQENVAACVNTAAQYGAIAAMEGTQEPLRMMQQAYSRRRQIIVEGFRNIKDLICFAPRGAFYAFVDISATGMKAKDFAMDLLEKNRVIVVPGHAFGQKSDRYVRLSFATSEETIREGLRRIADYMEHRARCQ